MDVTYRTILGRPEDVRASFWDVLRTSSRRNFVEWEYEWEFCHGTLFMIALYNFIKIRVRRNFGEKN